MSDRLAAILLALLLAAPLCLLLDLEIFTPADTAGRAPLPPLSVEELKQHAEGLLNEPAPDSSEGGADTLAAN